MDLLDPSLSETVSVAIPEPEKSDRRAAQGVGKFAGLGTPGRRLKNRHTSAKSKVSLKVFARAENEQDTADWFKAKKACRRAA